VVRDHLLEQVVAAHDVAEGSRMLPGGMKCTPFASPIWMWPGFCATRAGPRRTPW
jgi:hypothetical protein